MPTAIEMNDERVRSALAAAIGSKSVGQELEPPRHHPFPARMPLPLAKHIISSLTTKRATVLDPMVGSGTTMIAAKQLQRVGFGYDRDPMACIIARTSTFNYSRTGLEGLKKR